MVGRFSTKKRQQKHVRYLTVCFATDLPAGILTNFPRGGPKALGFHGLPWEREEGAVRGFHTHTRTHTHTHACTLSEVPHDPRGSASDGQSRPVMAGHPQTCNLRIAIIWDVSRLSWRGTGSSSQVMSRGPDLTWLCRLNPQSGMPA